MRYYLLFISHSWEEGNLYLKFFLALLMGILPRSDIGMGFAASVRGSEVNCSGKQVTTLKYWSVASVLLWLILFLAVSANSVSAHGEHGDAAPAEGGVSLVTFGDYQIELLTSPRPARAGEENKIIAKIVRNGSLEPVRGGKVLISVSPIQAPNRSGPGDRSSVQPADSFSLLPAPEIVWAGQYALVSRLDERGPYLVRVALLELEGKHYQPPASVEFRLNVASATGATPGFILVALAALAIGLVGITAAALRPVSAMGSKAPINLLEIGWFSRWVRWKGFLPLLQIPFLLLTLLIIFLGFFDVQDGAKNLATKLTWILWWPGIIFTFILVGRLWCVMCPFGTLNEWAANLVRPDRLFPKFLRNLWLATFFFVFLTWADEQLGIIRSPQMTAWLIIILGVIAFATGIIFQRRSFCRYLCPITGLQGLYSMVSPVELRSVDRSRCLKECHQDCYRGNEGGRGCPMFEFPMTMERNTYCNFCFECVKSCPPGNLTLRLRPFAKDLWASGRRWLDESYLALVLVGITTIVTAQMLSGWGLWISRMARLIPLELRILMKPVTYLTFTESLIFLGGSLLFFPILGLLVSWAADRMAAEEGRGLKKTFVHLGYMFIPVGLAMHLAHNASHFLLEGPGVIPAFQQTLNRTTTWYTGYPGWQPQSWVSSEVVYWLQMVLILGGLILSLVVGFRLARTLWDRQMTKGKALIPLIVLTLLFTLINLYLLNQPMGMRHGM